MKGIPYLKFEKDHICNACQLGKQNQVLFQNNQGFHDIKTVEVNSMDLFGPTKTKCLSGNRFVFVLVDNFSRFT